MRIWQLKLVKQSKNNLAQSHFHTYNAKLFNRGIKMTFKHIVFNLVGKSKEMKKYTLKLINED